MAVGEHTVSLLPDPDLGTWSAPLGTNSDFAASAAGWALKPTPTPGYGPVWSSAPGGALVASGISRDPATGAIGRPFGVTHYRLRARLTSWAYGLVNFGIFCGPTANDAWGGPGGGRVADQINGVITPGATFLGVYDVDQVFDVTPYFVHPAYGFISPWLFVSENGGPTGDATMVIEYLTLEALDPGGPIDLSCLVDTVTINHGRDGATGQPEAASATIDFTVTPDDPLPDGVDIGRVVEVTTATPTLFSTRFVGRITDLSLGWEDADELTPDSGIGQLVCTSLMTDMARRWTTSVAWPQELDGRRVQRIFEWAFGFGPPVWNPLDHDPGRVQIIALAAADNPAAVALDLARAVAEDASGMWWHDREGVMHYADSEHRRNAVIELELDACDLLVTPTWRRTTDGLANDIAIGYGDGAGGDQPTVTRTDAVSIQRYGLYGYTATTQLAAQADADAMASLIIARNAAPVWVMASLPVDVVDLDDARTDELLSLDVHSLVNLTGLPAIGDAPTSAVLWVEGWTETLAFGEHDLALVVSGFCRTSPPPRWDDVDPAVTWNNADPSWTWDSLACLGPTVDRGRWNDIPASLRWDTVNPALTWDTYA